MPGITLRVLDGADRGQVFDGLQAPVTIGREDGNTIQLNDERVSRFHVKIMKDHDRIVLTDLGSTNGTRVNNEDTQLRNLRPGDLIYIGRSLLVYGSRDEIDERYRRLSKEHPDGNGRRGGGGRGVSQQEYENDWRDKDDLRALSFLNDPPELPDRLSPGQAAQLAELLTYMHARLRTLLDAAEPDSRGEKVSLDLTMWQNLVDLQARLAEYLRSIGEPDQTMI